EQHVSRAHEQHPKSHDRACLTRRTHQRTTAPGCGVTAKDSMTKYRIRLTEMRDIPYIEELHRQQNERDGTNYPLTQVFDEHGYQMTNVVLSVVIVDEADKVHQG